MKLDEITLWRSISDTTNRRTPKTILPSTHHRSPSFSSASDVIATTSSSHTSLIAASGTLLRLTRRDHIPTLSFSLPLSLPQLPHTRSTLASLLRSLLKLLSPPASPACKWLALPSPLGRHVTGTLFGHRRGHVTFSVQPDPTSDPVILLELPISTSSLVKEMSSGLLRIALESPAARARRGAVKLFDEPVWATYCNGRKCGYAVSRACSEFDWHALTTVRSVSAGAGVIPVCGKVGGGGESEDGELLYMRARFERVVGSRDSEAFYMLNPDGSGGPDLSIFLLRL